MAVSSYTSRATAYFPFDGKANLRDALKLLQRAMKKREDLRNLKIVFFTSYGEGPLLALKQFRHFDPTIIAVTFSPTTVGPLGKPHTMPGEVVAYLKAMNVKIINSRLPFDTLGGGLHETEFKSIVASLSIIGRSFPLCVQAVLQACDAGYVEERESVIGVTGDCVAIFVASQSKHFLAQDSSFMLQEFICKPRVRGEGPPVTRKLPSLPMKSEPRVIEGTLEKEDLFGSQGHSHSPKQKE